jgi:recyclin-1
VEYIFATKQLASDYCPPPAAVTGYMNSDLEPTPTAKAVVNYLKTHTKLLQGSTDKGVLDVFFQEVGLRFFVAICKHVKSLKINTDGGIKLISYSPTIPLQSKRTSSLYFLSVERLVWESQLRLVISISIIRTPVLFDRSN